MVATLATETALFICPLFLERGHLPGYPQPKACPGVKDNKCYLEPGEPKLFGDRGLEITKYLVLSVQLF